MSKSVRRLLNTTVSVLEREWQNPSPFEKMVISNIYGGIEEIERLDLELEPTVDPIPASLLELEPMQIESELAGRAQAMEGKAKEGKQNGNS